MPAAPVFLNWAASVVVSTPVWGTTATPAFSRGAPLASEVRTVNLACNSCTRTVIVLVSSVAEEVNDTEAKGNAAVQRAVRGLWGRITSRYVPAPAVMEK